LPFKIYLPACAKTENGKRNNMMRKGFFIR
jgi:hypothetical protein